MSMADDQELPTPRAKKRRAGLIVALAVLSGIAVLIPSFVALATSLFAAAAELLS